MPQRRGQRETIPKIRPSDWRMDISAASRPRSSGQCAMRPRGIGRKLVPVGPKMQLSQCPQQPSRMGRMNGKQIRFVECEQQCVLINVQQVFVGSDK